MQRPATVQSIAIPIYPFFLLEMLLFHLKTWKANDMGEDVSTVLEGEVLMTDGTQIRKEDAITQQARNS